MQQRVGVSTALATVLAFLGADIDGRKGAAEELFVTLAERARSASVRPHADVVLVGDLAHRTSCQAAVAAATLLRRLRSTPAGLPDGPGSVDEGRSWLRRLAVPAARIDHVARLLSLDDHIDLDGQDEDAEVYVDVCRSPLGAAWHEYAEWRANAALFASISGSEWASHRRRWVERMLARPNLFYTPEMRAVYEGRGLYNLARERKGQLPNPHELVTAGASQYPATTVRRSTYHEPSRRRTQ